MGRNVAAKALHLLLPVGMIFHNIGEILYVFDTWSFSGGPHVLKTQLSIRYKHNRFFIEKQRLFLKSSFLTSTFGLTGWSLPKTWLKNTYAAN